MSFYEILNNIKVANLSIKRIKSILNEKGITITGRKASAIMSNLREIDSGIKAQGIYLKPPHGQYIWEGKKTLVVKSRPFNIVRRSYILVSGDFAYGIINFTKQDKIDIAQFDKLKPYHLITDTERKEWWANDRELYAYEFKFTPYSEPIEVKVPRGTQNFIRKVKVDAKFIKDIETFNPEKIDTKELLRDWALVLAWYSNFMQKKRNVPSAITSSEQLEDLAFLIYKELRKRGTIFDFERYKGYSQELFEKILYREQTGLRARTYAPIQHGHLTDYTKPIYLNDILNRFKTFKTKSPWVYLVGGIVNHGYTYGDVDLLIRGKPDKVLEFRIGRMFPPELAQRIHFLYDENDYGPYTNYVEIFDQIANVKELIVKEMAWKRITPPFPYWGGKRRQATVLRKYIPAHRTYCEPLAGSAALYFAKPPSEIEVLNDWNRKIIDVFLFLRDGTPRQFALIRRYCPLHISPSFMKRWKKKYKNKKSKTRMGKVVRFLLYVHSAFFGVPEDESVSFQSPKKLRFLMHLEEYKERLQNTRLYCMDWKKVIRKYDSKDTFFFLDPPYSTSKRSKAYAGEKYGVLPHDEIIKVLKTIKGKFMLTHISPSLRDKLRKQGYRTADIKFVHAGTSIVRRHKYREYVCTNYPLRKTQEFDIVIDKAEQEAKISRAEDRIKLFRFYDLLKGVVGYREAEVYNIPSLVSIVKERKFFPIEVQKKYDGFRCSIHKKGDKVVIYSEQGREFTDRFPAIVREMKEVTPEDVIVEGEIEGYPNGYETEPHLGRSDTAGYANAKTPVNEKDYYLTIYECTYFRQDLHKKPRDERRKIYSGFKETEKIKISPSEVAENETELTELVDKYRKLPFSEGAMLKQTESTYPLTGRTAYWIKFKNEADLDVMVVEKHRVEGQEAWNYLTVIRDAKTGLYVPAGRTYNTKINVPLKAIIRVAFVNINKYTDEKTGKVWFNMWSPRVIEYREDKNMPDTTTLADELVAATRGEIGIKSFPKRYKMVPENIGIQMASTKEDYVTLRFLGTKGDIEEESALRRHHSGILITYGDKKLLIDFGKSLGPRISLEGLRPDYILLTHAHSDHVGGIVYNPRKTIGTEVKYPIYCSEITGKTLTEQASKNLVSLPNLNIIEQRKTVVLGPFEITRYDTKHSIKFPSNAYKISVGNLTYLLSSDIISFKDGMKEEAFKDVNVYIGDGSALKTAIIRRTKNGEIYGHVAIPTQVKWCKDYNVKICLFTHFGKEAVEMEEDKLSAFLENTAKMIGYEGKIKAARDGLVVRTKIKDTEQHRTTVLTDPFLEIPFKKKTRFTLHAHIRAKSVHLDNRRQVDEDYLVGFTHYIPKGLSREPLDFEDAKKLYYTEIHPLVVAILKDPKKKLLSGRKSLQPIDWLDVSGFVEKGEVGATRFKRGYFIIIDKGDIEFLAAKPDYHEYWFHGDLLKGKYVDRLIINKAEWKKVGEIGTMSWHFFKSDAPPYVLSKRSILHNYKTPFTVSQLPEHIEKKVPPRYRYWLVEDELERFAKRKELVNALNRRVITLQAIGKEIPFKLQRQTWRGPIIRRIGPTTIIYRLIFKIANKYLGFEFPSNPLESETSADDIVFHKEFWDAEGNIKPQTRVNPTKETPSRIELIDSGTAKVLIWDDLIKRLVYKGKHMIGTYQIVRYEMDTPWIISRFKINMELGNLRYSLNPDTQVLYFEGDLILPITVEAKKVTFTEDLLKNAKLDPREANKNIAYINIEHRKDEWTRVGMLTRTYWSNDTKTLRCEGNISEKSLIEKIVKDGYKPLLSAEITYEETPEGLKNLIITGAAITETPAIRGAKIDKVCDETKCIKLSEDQWA